MYRRAVILAGGLGTRLSPYTIVLPKPLMPVGEYPILEVVVRQLAHYKFERITIAVNHQVDLIHAFFGNGSKWGVQIDYSIEDKPLGTMGPLKLINDLPDNFLVMNGDILTELDYGKFFDEHLKKGSLFTIASSTREEVSEFGVLDVSKTGFLAGFKEKPVKRYQVSMGIYMVNKKVLRYLPEDKPYGFDKLMHDLLKSKEKVRVKSHSGYWLDIGRPDDYARAIEEFDRLKVKLLK
ncbi:MAG: sugar phosphate nucleotidyltransferase [Candidatus Omnitrophota bacterium]|nr:sugar phosphate nucleotidyltransferase [Candidatus Omnitrophota bacterium]